MRNKASSAKRTDVALSKMLRGELNKMKRRFILSMEYDSDEHFQKLLPLLAKLEGELFSESKKLKAHLKITSKTEFVCPQCGGNCDEVMRELVQQLRTRP